MFTMPVLLIVVGVLVGVAVALAIAWPRWKQRQAEVMLDHARREFHLRREWLEASFLKLASKTGLPRGLKWVDCDFDNPVCLARDRSSGHLRALVGVTIAFSAIAGGGMEDVEAVGNLRAATAVFRFENGAWTTDGWAIFNLNPSEAIEHYHRELELVD